MGCAVKNFLIHFMKGMHCHAAKEHPVNLPLFCVSDCLQFILQHVRIPFTCQSNNIQTQELGNPKHH